MTITSSEQTVVLPFTATETESDLHPADNAASTSAVVGRPDLSTALQASINPVPFNANVTYTATVTNNGTATATAPHVTFTRPTGTTSQTASAPGGCAVTSGGADCQLGALPVGQSVTATYTVKNTGGGTASVTADAEPAGQTDRNPADNATTIWTRRCHPSSSPDLGVALQLGPDPSPLGNALTATVTLSNIGSAPAASSQVARGEAGQRDVTAAVLDDSTACTLTASGAVCTFGALNGAPSEPPR